MTLTDLLDPTVLLMLGVGVIVALLGLGGKFIFGLVGKSKTDIDDKITLAVLNKLQLDGVITEAQRDLLVGLIEKAKDEQPDS